MTELLITALVGTFTLGLAAWQISRVISDGDIFEPMRGKLWVRYWEKREHDTLFSTFYRGVSCRLCFGTQVAIVLTWGALIVALMVDRSELPAAVWGFAFIVGPFLTAAWSEVLRRVECLEAPN